jgi:hypothetical protein
MQVITEAEALHRAFTNTLSSTRQRREAERTGHLGIMLRQLDALLPRLKQWQDEQQRQERQRGSGEESVRLAGLIDELEALRAQALTPV